MKKMTPEEVEETMQQLLQMGLVEDSGKRRGGKIVWRLSDKGRNPIYRDRVLKASEELFRLEDFSD
jgi:DNA-binding transcriptional ArsR family regulator